MRTSGLSFDWDDDYFWWFPALKLLDLLRLLLVSFTSTIPRVNYSSTHPLSSVFPSTFNSTLWGPSIFEATSPVAITTFVRPWVSPVRVRMALFCMSGVSSRLVLSSLIKSLVEKSTQRLSGAFQDVEAVSSWSRVNYRVLSATVRRYSPYWFVM